MPSSRPCAADEGLMARAALPNPPARARACGCATWPAVPGTWWRKARVCVWFSTSRIATSVGNNKPELQLPETATCRRANAPQGSGLWRTSSRLTTPLEEERCLVLARESVCLKIFRHLIRQTGLGRKVLLIAHQDVFILLLQLHTHSTQPHAQGQKARDSGNER